MAAPDAPLRGAARYRPAQECPSCAAAHRASCRVDAARSAGSPSRRAALSDHTKNLVLEGLLKPRSTAVQDRDRDVESGYPPELPRDRHRPVRMGAEEDRCQ